MVLSMALPAMAQPDLPVLNANSKTVDVQDGERFFKGVWVIDPAVALDVYDAQRTLREKRITFITDIDSISFDVEPGHNYDFIILFDGKDACRTRISTMRQGFRRVSETAGPRAETIPISISHGMLHLKGKFNSSDELDLIFDTGAETNLLYPSAARKGALLRLDGTTNNVGTGGATLRRTSSDNRLQISGLVWEHEPVIQVEKQAGKADGLVGCTLFDGQVIEIDYDRMILLVQDQLPARAAEFSKTSMVFSGALPAVAVGLIGNGLKTNGLFILDTAGTGAMNVNQAFATGRGLRGAFQKIGTSASRGLGSAAIRNEVVLVPELTLAGFTIRNVPIHVELPSDGNPAPPGGVVCMEVLKRFNTILDYRRNEAYFKPNTLFGEPFKTGSLSKRWSEILVLAVVVAALILGLIWFLARGRQRAGERLTQPT
jgi:hypothetical protein